MAKKAADPCLYPSTLQVARAIGRVTFQEMLRDKLLYNIVLFAVLLLGLGFLVSKLSFIRPDRMILDFGLSALQLACALVAIFGGASLLGREFERRTAQAALSRPISRAQFIFGKYFGLACVLTLNWALLVLAYFSVLILAGDTSEGHSIIHGSLLLGLLLVWVQSLLLSSLALFFSSFSTTSLAVVFSIGCYCVGNNISQLRFLAAKVQSGAGKMLLNALATVFPNLEYFHLGARVTYGLPIPASYVFEALAYGFCFTALALFCAGWIIRWREITR